MKLLFDQNLSPRLARLVGDLYPGSLHVREIGLRDAEDAAIWEYAKQNGFIIISKDSDFQARSLLYGSPPKFIWLRVGNCTMRSIEELVRKHSATIHTFAIDHEKTHLMLP
jgi:predicted nuclease of predicted toxin-antitoxin system